MKRFAVTAFLIACSHSVASAHPGHGDTPHGPDSIMHYVVEPIHLPAVIAFAATAFLIVVAIRNRRANLR